MCLGGKDEAPAAVGQDAGVIRGREAVVKSLVELPGLEKELNFDGEWLWKPVSPANLRLAPARFAEIGRDVTLKSDTEREEALRSYCGRFETERVACCCNACLSGLEIGLGREGRAVHMAQLLFPETAG